MGLVTVVSCLRCIAWQLAFTLALFASVRVIVNDTESRTKPKTVIRCSGMTDDFSAVITYPKLVNNVCVSKIFIGYSLVSYP